MLISHDSTKQTKTSPLLHKFRQIRAVPRENIIMFAHIQKIVACGDLREDIAKYSLEDEG